MLVEYKRAYCFIIDTATFPDDWDFDGTEESARDCLGECDIEDLYRRADFDGVISIHEAKILE